MWRRTRWFVMIVLSAVWGDAVVGWAQATQKYGTMMVRTVTVPDLRGKSMQQVQAEVGGLMPGTRSRMFAGIDSQGPADGVVASQNPVTNAQVVPGTTRLLLTLETPKPSAFATFVDQLAAGLAAREAAAAQKMVVVPALLGYTRVAASRYVAASRLRASFTGSDDGVVAQQYPVAGSSVRPGTVVVVTMALPPVVVPSLFGLTLREAVQKLKAASLLDAGVSGEIGEGSTVVAQSIAPGVQVPPQTAVNVTMRAARVEDVFPPPPPPKIAVPDLTAKTGANAEAELAGLGLRIGAWKGPPTWIVKTQAPSAGIEVDQGSEVDVTLAAPTVVVPDVRRDNETVAKSSLKTFGLQARISYALNGNTTAPHIVVEQKPAAGAVVDEGSTVDVTIGFDTPPPTRTRRMWEGLAAAVPLAPWWVWLALGLPIGGLGVRVLGRGRTPSLPEPDPSKIPPSAAVCTLSSAQPEGRVNTVGSSGPELRFKISLQDRVGEGAVHTGAEPAVRKIG